MRYPRICVLLLTLTPVTWAADAAPTPADVDAAIERGVDWLLDDQKGNGSWDNDPGKSALATFALMHAGLREDTPGTRGKRMARAWRWLDRFGPGAREHEPKAQTYWTSLMLLALDVRGRQADRPRMQRLVEQLVVGHAANGQWTYDLRPGEKAGDNSNTQFAVLALGVAWAHELRIPRTTLERARAWWQGSAHGRGGFGYASGGSKNSQPKLSMTAAGIASLSILDSALQRGATHARKLLMANPVLRAVYDRLSRDFALTPPPVRSRRKGTAGQSWPHYYLWTLERALVLLGVREVKDIDWFAEGTRHLVATQKKDGSWRGEAPLYATSFALLFLTRAADPPRVFTRSAPVTGAQQPVPSADPAVTGTVDDWLTESLPPAELVRRCELRGPGSLLPLVGALDHPDRKLRHRAFEALSNLLAPSRLQGVDKHPLPRARLRFWLRRHATSLTWKGDRFDLP